MSRLLLAFAGITTGRGNVFVATHIPIIRLANNTALSLLEI